jgi:hypothetical protein
MGGLTLGKKYRYGSRKKMDKIMVMLVMIAAI